MVDCDLTKACFVPGEQCAADPTPAVLGVHEADLAVDTRAVDLVVPRDAAVRDGQAVELGDEQIARRVAALEVVVRGRQRLGGLDAFVSLATRRGGDDAREDGVVGAPTEHPEGDAVELG